LDEGILLGSALGADLGAVLGSTLGAADGIEPGSSDGTLDGSNDGKPVGSLHGVCVGAGVRAALTVPCVTVAPIVELASCNIAMKGPSLSPSKALFSCCERPSPDTDDSSYSTVIIILYLKLSSLLNIFLEGDVTNVTVRVMLLTTASGKTLEMVELAYSSAMIRRAVILI